MYFWRFWFVPLSPIGIHRATLPLHNLYEKQGLGRVDDFVWGFSKSASRKKPTSKQARWRRRSFTNMLQIKWNQFRVASYSASLRHTNFFMSIVSPKTKVLGALVMQVAFVGLKNHGYSTGKALPYKDVPIL